MKYDNPIIRYNVVLTSVKFSAARVPIKQFERLIYNSPVECKTKSLPFRTNALIDFGVTNYDSAVDLLHRFLREHFFNGETGIISIVKTTQTSKYCLYTSIVDTFKYQLLIEEQTDGNLLKVVRYAD